MESIEIGDRVTVTGPSGPGIDGIVFDLPSRSKAVVAVIDAARGPVFRTIDPKRLTERPQEGAQDHALRLLIRRTPAPAHGAGRGGATGQRNAPGFTRGATHRPTGR